MPKVAERKPEPAAALAWTNKRPTGSGLYYVRHGTRGRGVLVQLAFSRTASGRVIGRMTDTLGGYKSWSPKAVFRSAGKDLMWFGPLPEPPGDFDDAGNRRLRRAIEPARLAAPTHCSLCGDARY